MVIFVVVVVVVIVVLTLRLRVVHALAVRSLHDTTCTHRRRRRRCKVRYHINRLIGGISHVVGHS